MVTETKIPEKRNPYSQYIRDENLGILVHNELYDVWEAAWVACTEYMRACMIASLTKCARGGNHGT